MLNDLRKTKFYTPDALEIDSQWAKKALFGGVFSKQSQNDTEENAENN